MLNSNQAVPFFTQAFNLDGHFPGRAAVRDQQGFLWIGTQQSGLIRYDGVRKKIFNTDNFGLSSNQIYGLLEDRDGDLWIGTNNGINRYQKNSAQLIQYFHDPENPDNSLANDQITFLSKNLVQDTFGDIWIATQRGLSRFNKQQNRMTSYYHNPADVKSLPGNKIQTLLADTKGNLWVTTNQGGISLFNREKNNFTHFPLSKNNQPLRVVSLLQDRLMRIWLVAWDETANQMSRLLQFNPEQGYLDRNIILPDEINRSRLDLIAMNEGEIGIFHPVYSGLYIYDVSAREDSYNGIISKEAVSLSSKKVVYAFTDRSDITWIIHSSGEVDHSNPYGKLIKTFSYQPGNPNSLAGSTVARIYEDKNDMWFGLLGEGLNRYNKKTQQMTLYKPNQKDIKALPHGYPSGIYEDEEGHFFVSTADGLVLFDRERGEVTRHITRGTAFYDFAPDPDSADWLWGVGWEQGLVKVNWRTGEMINYYPPEPPEKEKSTILILIVDDEDPYTLWLADWNSGLGRFNIKTQSFKYFNIESSNGALKSNAVRSIISDSIGRYWLATDKGLHLFNKETQTFRHIDSAYGLGMNDVQNVNVDLEGNLWLASGSGDKIVAYNFDKKKTLATLTKKDNFLGGLHAFFNLETGYLWYGSQNGVSVFDPREILKLHSAEPKLAVTAFTQNMQPIKLGQAPELTREIQVGWRHNNFEFKAVVLEERLADNINYQYFLQGYDKQWHLAKSGSYIYYTNLPGGLYQLQLRLQANLYAASNQVVEELKIAVQVDYPPWLRWWAWCLYIIAILIFLGGGIMWWRTRVLLSQERLLSSKDRLTGLPNRRAYEQAFHKKLNIHKPSLPMAVSLVDIDHFKKINDRYGHTVGDQVLVEVTGVLQASLRQTDFVARWGGEEFIILMSKTSIEQAEQVVEKLRKAIAEKTFYYDDTYFAVTASFGLAEVMLGEGLKSVFERADRSLYQAKTQGRNRLVVANVPADGAQAA